MTGVIGWPLDSTRLEEAGAGAARACFFKEEDFDDAQIVTLFKFAQQVASRDVVPALASSHHFVRAHQGERHFGVTSTLLTLSRFVATAAACEPTFELISLLPRLLFRSRLVDITVPMFSTGVGLVTPIEAFLFRPTPVARRARLVSSTLGSRPRRTTVVFPY